MKKFLFLVTIMIALFTTNVEASEINDDTTQIPEMSIEELIQTMKARQAKVDIIKKNNREITTLKEQLKNQIIETAQKINNLQINISNETVIITEEALEELKELLTFLQNSKKILEEDVESISSEIEQILDLISTKGMRLDQYDLIIEKQNEVIVEMKAIMQTVSKI